MGALQISTIPVKELGDCSDGRSSGHGGSLITLKRFLYGSEEKPENPEQRVLPLLIEALAVHAVEYNAENKAKFQRSIRALGEQLSESGDDAESLALGGEIIHSLQSYNQTAEEFMRAHSKEMQGIVGMLTKSLVRFCGNVQSASGNLQELEHQIETASTLGDIRAVKAKLGEQLEAVQAHVAAEKELYAELKQRMEQSLSAPQGGGEPLIDPATGLGSLWQAETVLREIATTRRGNYVAVFVIERMAAINARFGFGAGDEVLLTAAQHLAQHLGSGAELFRWRGPVIVAVLQRDCTLEALRMEIAKLASVRLERTLKNGSRSVLLPIAFAWTVLPAVAPPPLPQLITRVNWFLTQQSSPRAHAKVPA